MRHWLMELRKNNNLTQREVAQKAGISRSYYAEIELGVKNPGGRTAKKIADVFKIDMALFF
jgi:putative transcriptional regulator